MVHVIFKNSEAKTMKLPLTIPPYVDSMIRTGDI